ncbi:MAG: hypothetical protein FJZ47_24455, partial [Candidatus Tectomicrobia bacterium]|nr:hypothetical protein [Candidatus Tectomicrobia bacterium]
MRRRLRKIVTWLALGMLGLLGLLYITVIHPLYEPLRDPLVRLATRLISQSLHGTLEIGALRGSLFSNPALYNVVLRDAQGTVVGQIDALRLRYNLLALLHGRLEVHTVEISRPQLHVAQAPDGTLNLLNLVPASDTPSTSGGGLPFAVHLETVHIAAGQVTLELPAVPGVRQVDGLYVQLRARIDRDDMQVQLHQGTARTSPAAVTLQTLQGAVRMQGGVIQLEQVRLQTEEALITAHGHMPGGGAPADVIVQMQPLALAEIGRLLHNDGLRDALHLNLQVQGPASALRFQGHVRTPAARVDLQGQLNTAAVPPQYEAQLSVSHLDLAALAGQAALQSDLNLRLRVEGEGVALQELRSVLQLEVQASHLGALVIRPSVMHLTAAQQRLQVERVHLDTSVAHVTASGALDMDGTSQIQYAVTADLAHWRQMLGTQELDGTLRLQGQASGAWPEVRLQGTLSAEQLRYEAQRLQTLRLTYEALQLG